MKKQAKKAVRKIKATGRKIKAFIVGCDEMGLFTIKTLKPC